MRIIQCKMILLCTTIINEILYDPKCITRLSRILILQWNHAVTKQCKWWKLRMHHIRRYGARSPTPYCILCCYLLKIRWELLACDKHVSLACDNNFAVRDQWFTSIHRMKLNLRLGATPFQGCIHYIDVIMSAMELQITSLTVVYSTVYSGADQRNHQSSLAFVRGIHRWPVNSPHNRPVTRKMFPFYDVIMS